MDYQYSIQRHFPRGRLNVNRMTMEINESVLSSIFTEITVNADVCTITFSQALTPAENIILNGMVSQHSGEPIAHGAFLAIIPVVGTEHEITETDWTDVGGVVIDAQIFPKETTKVVARLIGQISVAGDAATLQMKKDDDSVIYGPITVPDTASAWVNFVGTMELTTPLNAETALYTVQAKVGATESMFFRYTSIELVEII